MSSDKITREIRPCRTCRVGGASSGSWLDGCPSCDAPEVTVVADPPELNAQFFRYEHLQNEKMREISKRFHDFARQLIRDLPRNSQRTKTIDKIIEAKDCAFRALLFDHDFRGLD